jgi:hypothetical protein
LIADQSSLTLVHVCGLPYFSGVIVDALDASGQAENTVVILTSEYGAFAMLRDSIELATIGASCIIAIWKLHHGNYIMEIAIESRSNQSLSRWKC